MGYRYAFNINNEKWTPHTLAKNLNLVTVARFVQSNLVKTERQL